MTITLTPEQRERIIAEMSSKIRLTADCGCGGKMIPHPRKSMIWICDRSHYWDRRKHAYLVVSAELKDKSA